MNGIHPSALIDPTARVGDGVEIGPFAIVGPNCVVGDGSVVSTRAVLERNVTLGVNVKIGVGTVLGGDPQDLKFKGEETFVEIGDQREINLFEVKGNSEAARQTPMFGRGRLDHLGYQAASIEAFEEIRRRLIAVVYETPRSPSFQALTQVRKFLEPHVGTVGLQVTDPDFQIDSLQPALLRDTQGPDGLRLTFAPPANGGEFTMVMWCRPRHFGLVDLTAGLGALDSIRRVILIYP